MTIKRLVRLVTVTLREDQQEFNIQRSPIEKKGGGGEGKRKRKKRKKKKKKDEAIDAFFFLQRKASSSRQGWKWNKASDVRINTRLNYKSSGRILFPFGIIENYMKFLPRFLWYSFKKNCGMSRVDPLREEAVSCKWGTERGFEAAPRWK